MSTRDIQNLLEETYGVEVSADTIRAITDKIWTLVEAWQNRPLAAIYPIIYLEGFHVKLRRQGRVEKAIPSGAICITPKAGGRIANCPTFSLYTIAISSLT